MASAVRAADAMTSRSAQPFEVADLYKAPLASEVVRRTAIFAIDREINDAAAGQEFAVRQERLKPLVNEIEAWRRS
jgi:transposase